MDTKELIYSTGETIEYAKIYMEQQADYMKLSVSKKLAKTTSNLITIAVISILAFTTFLLLSVSIGFFIGSYLGSYGLGFLIIAVIYIVLTGLIYIFRNQMITNPILSNIISELMD